MRQGHDPTLGICAVMEHGRTRMIACRPRSDRPASEDDIFWESPNRRTHGAGLGKSKENQG